MAEKVLHCASEFDRLHEQADPFGLCTRWYERRKRSILTAALPHASYARGWEIGCSNGELTAALAGRCARLLATDISQRAVQLAQARNAVQPHVRIERASHPDDWPDGLFDLIVLSEVGYYLGTDALVATAAKIQQSLAPNAVFVACHWLTPFEGACADGAAVHRAIADCMVLPLVCHYRDADFLLDVWSADPFTPAEREGLK